MIQGSKYYIGSIIFVIIIIIIIRERDVEHQISGSSDRSLMVD